MGFYGGDHDDKYDFAGSFSCMITCSSLPTGYEDGRFHILALGCYISLSEVQAVYFTGRLRHGGTPPLAPPGVSKEALDPSAYRCVVICYPASRIITGATRIPMCAGTNGGEPISIAIEMLQTR